MKKTIFSAMALSSMIFASSAFAQNSVTVKPLYCVKSRMGNHEVQVAHLVPQLDGTFNLRLSRCTYSNKICIPSVDSTLKVITEDGYNFYGQGVSFELMTLGGIVKNGYYKAMIETQDGHLLMEFSLNRDCYRF